MLVASAIQGQVVSVYNAENQEVCSDQQQERDSAPPAQTDSLPQSVKTPQLLNKRTRVS